MVRHTDGGGAQIAFTFAPPAGLVCGVDEAGRGPLAGPVYAAAVILSPSRPIRGLRDSKVLTAAQRETLALRIRDRSIESLIALASCTQFCAQLMTLARTAASPPPWRLPAMAYERVPR